MGLDVGDEPAADEVDDPVGPVEQALVVGDDQDRGLPGPASASSVSRFITSWPEAASREAVGSSARIRVGSLTRAPGDRDPLPLAAGEVRGEVVHPRTHADPLQDRVGPPVHLARPCRLQSAVAMRTFSIAVSEEKRLCCWKMKPMSARCLTRSLSAEPGQLVPEHPDAPFLHASARPRSGSAGSSCPSPTGP